MRTGVGRGSTTGRGCWKVFSAAVPCSANEDSWGSGEQCSSQKARQEAGSGVSETKIMCFGWSAREKHGEMVLVSLHCRFFFASSSIFGNCGCGERHVQAVGRRNTIETLQKSMKRPSLSSCGVEGGGRVKFCAAFRLNHYFANVAPRYVHARHPHPM